MHSAGCWMASLLPRVAPMPPARELTPADNIARLWLARSLAAAGPVLRALADDPTLYAPRPPVAGSAPPIPPTPAELDAAATTIERAASALRHAAGGEAP